MKKPLEPCIYCFSDKPPRKGRDHVIPELLGTFEQSWTLDCVCDQCNKFFGDTVELTLGRDSAEAFLRIEAGVKPPSSAENFKGKHMKFTVQGTEHFDGARARMRASEDGAALLPVVDPQVALRKPGGVWSFMFEKDLSVESIREWLQEPYQVKILGNTPDVERLRERLLALGMPFTTTEHLHDQPLSDGPALEIEHEFFVTTAHRRAAAKIVFNYTAKVLGPSTVRRSEFDAVRKFVRLGLEPAQVVFPSEAQILVGADADVTQTHACGISWVEERQRLVGALRLFNRVTYGVLLCNAAHEEWIGVSFHHLFDPVSRTITDVTPR